MGKTKYNATAATLTKNRTFGSVSPGSGLCVTCVDGCVGMCEVGKSAYRSGEVIYPQPFGIITTASEKEFPVNLGDFQIMSGVVGAKGIEADSDKAIFPNVKLETKIGQAPGIKLRMPVVYGGMGSTDVAGRNWDGFAAGAAISGVVLTVGENVVGMDMESEIVKGKVVNSPELIRRVKLFKDWYDGYGAVVVQANVEDTRLGVQEYALQKLGVDTVELKWGQGAKNIGGEVKIHNLKKAQRLKERGYVVLPDPTHARVIKAFDQGAFKEFERHSRVGMVEEASFMKRVKELRAAGAKYVFLKTGAYRPADLALALKFASKAKIDFLTVDASGGGTGMSPWRMMNEWGVPPVELYSLLFQYCERLAKQGEYVPHISVAGGIAFEDQIFKCLSLGAPYFKAVEMARAPLTAAMVGKTIGKRISQGDMPVYVGRFGNSLEEVFVCAGELKDRLGKDFEKLPPGAIGVYSYMQRLAQGLRQLMAGCRKFTLESLTRGDLCSLTRECAEISGIPHVMDLDRAEADKILAGDKVLVG